MQAENRARALAFWSRDLAHQSQAVVRAKGEGSPNRGQNSAGAY